MDTKSLAVEYVPANDIRPARRNAKAHDQAAIRSSIERFGFFDPVLVDGRTGLCVAGHGRAETLIAMRAEGASPPRGIHVADDGEWLVPVVSGWASKNDAEAEAAIIADNRASERGGWDQRSLAAMLEDLAESNPDLLDVAGFDFADVDRLLEEFPAPPPMPASFSDAEPAIDGGQEPRPGEEPVSFPEGRPMNAAPLPAGLSAVPQANERREGHNHYGEAAQNNWATSTVRTMLLEFRPPVFAWLVTALAEIAEKEHAKSNAETILLLVAKASGTNPPEETE